MKVAIYCRLSEEDRDKRRQTDDSNSIINQKNMLLQYAMQNGWEVVNVYSDDDYAGADRNRPKFKALLADAEARRFDIILCKTQSRFTREMELVEKYIHGLFPLWGIRFISLVDNGDTDNKGNKKSRQINGLVNEWYLEDMSESIKSALTSQRERGKHIGAFALYGYRKDPEEKGRLIIDEEAAQIVREVFVLFSQGYGKTAIARLLNDRGIPNPTEYKRLHGLHYQQPKGKNSTLWKYFSISDMLTNEIYIGNMVQGKYGSTSYKTKQNKPRPKEQWYRVEGTHEPIIEKELWNRVQAMIREKAKPFTVGEIGLFARKARCANCGYVMRSSKNHGKHYLQCPNRHIAKDACIGSFIAVDKLERIVLTELNRLSAQYLNREEVERGIVFSDSVQQQKERLLKHQAAYQKKLDEYRKALRELYLDKVNGVITGEDFSALSLDLSAERTHYELLAADTQKQLTELDERLAAGDSRRELVEQYTNIKRLNREMVAILIDHITVGKRAKGEPEPPIEIYWNF